jgi:hypothetical protein
VQDRSLSLSLFRWRFFGLKSVVEGRAEPHGKKDSAQCGQDLQGGRAQRETLDERHFPLVSVVSSPTFFPHSIPSPRSRARPRVDDSVHTRSPPPSAIAPFSARYRFRASGRRDRSAIHVASETEGSRCVSRQCTRHRPLASSMLLKLHRNASSKHNIRLPQRSFLAWYR